MGVNNSTNINKTNNYLSPQIIELVENMFVILSETILFPYFKHIKYLSGLSVLERKSSNAGWETIL